MREEFDVTLRVSAGVAPVWAVVSDVPTVLSWISIVESVEAVGSGYRVVLADRLGPFKLRADLDVVVTDRVPEQLMRAHGDGEDRQIASRLVVDVELALTEEEQGTKIDVRGSYEVTGRPASLGAGSIRKKARGILEEFFASAERSVGRVAL